MSLTHLWDLICSVTRLIYRSVVYREACSMHLTCELTLELLHNIPLMFSCKLYCQMKLEVQVIVMLLYALFDFTAR